MTELLTQEQLEKEMVDGGRARMVTMMQRNEDQGGAINNPYASAVFRRFVLPMANLIENDLADPRPQRQGRAVPLLARLDARAVAWLAVRNTLNMLMQGGYKARRIISSVGTTVHHEALLAVMEEAEPALFYTLLADLQGRLSKDERYRMTVFKMQAKKNGVELPEWGQVGVNQVGSYLVGLMEALGMIEVKTLTERKQGKPRSEIHAMLSPETATLVEEIKDFIIDNCPNVLPCVERPKPWLGLADGGWHTNGMRRLQPFAIKTEGAWSELEEYDLTTPLAAISALQDVEWQINRKILGAIKEIARFYDTEEIVGYRAEPAPMKPGWLTEDMKREQMTPEELDEFKEWRRDTAQWFSDQKIRGTKYGRFNLALRVAEKFAPYDKLWFVYFADFRGRLYAQTTGVSPQGSDMQKALLRFAVGKPLSTPEAVKWFKIAGANKFGYDKASLEARAAWVDEHDDILRRVGTGLGYLDDKFWLEADCPLQFLAWCLEYAQWRQEPSTFKSHLPVGMDGTCNGLQNFSAMLRDEVGGKATNLIPSSKPNDIYQMVADVAAQKLRDVGDKPVPEADGTDETDKVIRHFTAENRFRHLWLDHGINRSLVKRSVMTKPYGSTRFSCADFIVDDYLKAGKAREFAKEDYRAAARYLSRFVWAAISEVVVKADEAMGWLQQASKLILEEGQDIRWVTPTGFPVLQRYQRVEEVCLRTRIAGTGRLRVGNYSDAPDKAHHKNGVAPNFVHSMDASHMALVALAASREGMSLAMIHDDFGTHAADAERFYALIRQTFVAMYEQHDPLAEFAERYHLPNPPKPGRLDLRQVLDSPYFFS